MWLFGGILGMLIGASAAGFVGAIIGAILGLVVGLILKLVFRSDTSDIKKHLAQLDASILKINQRQTVTGINFRSLLCPSLRPSRDTHQ